MLSKFLSGSAIGLLLISLLIMAFLVYAAHLSRKASPHANSIKDHSATQLQPCSVKPNCVCSEYPDDKSHFIRPLAYEGASAAIHSKVKTAITDMGGTIISQQGTNYIAAEFKTPILRFVDDVEIRIDEIHQLVHFRSASRQGHSDLGKNRSRVAALKKRLQ